jgi:hypothetical protein
MGREDSLKHVFCYRHVPGFELRSACREASASTQNENVAFQRLLCRKNSITGSDMKASFSNIWQADLM